MIISRTGPLTPSKRGVGRTVAMSTTALTTLLSPAECAQEKQGPSQQAREPASVSAAFVVARYEDGTASGSMECLQGDHIGYREVSKHWNDMH